MFIADRTSEALEAIREAEALVERFEQRLHCAELRRLRGVFLATIGADETELDASFRRSHPHGKAAEVNFTRDARGSELREYRDRKAALARVRIDCRRRIPNCRVISRTCNFGQTVNTCRIFVCRDLTVRANISLRPRLTRKDRCPERSRDAAKAEAKLATEHPIVARPRFVRQSVWADVCPIESALRKVTSISHSSRMGVREEQATGQGALGG